MRPNRSLLVLALAAAAAGCTPAATAPAATAPARARADSLVNVATFDTAWARVRTHHYDSTFGGLDWDAVRAELRPRVEADPGTEAVRRAIRDMVSRFGVSHYALIPREVNEALDAGARERGAEATPADAGLELRALGSDVVVWTVEPAGPAAAAGLRPGEAVVQVEQFAPGGALADVLALGDARERQLALTRLLYGANALLDGAAGDTVRLQVRRGGDTVAVAVPLRPTPGVLVRFGNLPPTIARVAHERLDGAAGCVGVIRWNAWMAPIAAEIDRAVDAVRDCRGIVIDLRGNPGGVAGMVMGVGGHFVDSTRALGTMKLRSNELRFVLNPRRVDTRGNGVAVFGGPLAILVDAMSASTSEIFAAGMQAIGRARVFGEVTAGQALPALASRLPNGDVLMHAVADYLVADGSRVEGRGVIPDQPMALDAAALRAGRDPVLEAAQRWILQAGNGLQ